MRVAEFMLDRDFACVAAGLARDPKTGEPLDGVALLGFIEGGWSWTVEDACLVARYGEPVDPDFAAIALEAMESADVDELAGRHDQRLLMTRERIAERAAKAKAEEIGAHLDAATRTAAGGDRFLFATCEGDVIIAADGGGDAEALEPKSGAWCRARRDMLRAREEP